MIQNPERMEYRWGTIKKAMRPEDLPAGVWCEADIPAHLRAAINAEDLFDLGGVHGDKTAGYPVEYDNLELLMTEDTVEITVYDRGIALFMSDDERIRPIHRVLWEPGATRNDRWPVQRQAWRRRHGQAACGSPAAHPASTVFRPAGSQLPGMHALHRRNLRWAGR